MKEILTKKLLVIISVVSLIVVGAVILTLVSGKTGYPGLSDPDGVFYQRVDDSGNVIYTITNQEIYDEIKSNDGISQLLYMIDTVLLSQYIDNVTDEEVANKILELTYGTSDPDEIAALDDDTKTKYEENYAQSMILSGYQDDEEGYARLIVARQNYVKDKISDDGTITENDVAEAYLNSYFEDISAIRIRFTSAADAKAVMQRFNLLSYENLYLREYNGYIFKHEDLKDPLGNLAEAFTTVDTYYFDEDQNILTSTGTTVYELGTNGIYSDGEDQFVLEQATGDLLNGLNEVVLSHEVIFDTEDEAVQYKEDHTIYFTVTRTDPFDTNETINVINALQEVEYTIDPSNDHIYDADSNDVTYTTDLYVNKVYTTIDKVTTVTTNNSTALSSEEVLAKYVEMYNYVYDLYRDPLPTGLTDNQYAALDNDYLKFNFETEADMNSNMATYMFDTLTLDVTRYTATAKSFTYTSDTYYYMVYKLTEVEKTDLMTTIFDDLTPLITIPTQIADSITLPTTTYYDGTITWATSNASVLTSLGTVTTPTEDTEVTLTYTMTVLGEKHSGTFTVTVLAEGTTEEVTEPTWDEIPLKTLINDDTAYDYLFNKLVDDYVYGDSGSANVDDVLIQTRTDCGLEIYDHFVALDYMSTDTSFVESTGDGSKIASLTKTLTSEDPVVISADQFYEFAVNRNAAMYTMYASQFKELLYSNYFTQIFGDQTDIKKNSSDMMTGLYDNISQVKQYFAYLQNLYAQYGMTFTYSNFTDYAYAQYGIKTELGLLEYFVQSKLQPFFIDEVMTANDVLTMLYPDVQDNFNNYFSLDVTHILVYLDYDEDGIPDNFDDYKASLSAAELDAFTVMEANLEQAIDEYDGTFDELVAEYVAATRDDETWGTFKQNGLFLLTENLNQVDSQDSTVTHSLTYSGTYGVKDTYDPAFVDALIALYDTYQQEQNLDKTEMYSNGLVASSFGLHYIMVEQGDDFDKPTAKFIEEDSDNPVYSTGAANEIDMPTKAQVELYAQYKLYSMVFDLNDTSIQETYGITVPNLPSSVTDALDVYLGDLLDGVYVIGTLNVDMADRMVDGEFVSGNTYSSQTNTDLMADIANVGTIYYDVIFGDYLN